MRRWMPWAFWGLVLAGAGLAQDENQPQRIALSWERDPATSQSVSWRTVRQLDNAAGQVVRVKGWARSFEDSARTVKARSAEIKTQTGAVYTHYNVRFDGLEPGVRYAYRVGCEEHWSEWNLFRTAGTDSEAFSFFYLGDVQNDIRSEVAPLLRAMYADEPQSRFIVFAGDLVNRGLEDSDWAEFFEAFGFIVRMTPLIAAPGNHDTNKEMLDDRGNRRVDPLYLAHFAFPQDGPEADPFKETAYTLDYQCARIIVLNSNAFNDDRQVRWLESVLTAPRKPWTIVLFHHPVYSTGSERDNKELRATLAPLFEKYGVDLVLQGHDHYYGRTGKILQEQIAAADAAAPVYAVSISGPKMYKQNHTFTHLMRRMIGETQLYQILTLSPQRLTYICKSLDGAVKDGFSLVKQDQGTVLVEKPLPSAGCFCPER